jgi:hypothetical protein
MSAMCCLSYGLGRLNSELGRLNSGVVASAMTRWSDDLRCGGLSYSLGRINFGVVVSSVGMVG